MRKTKPDTSLAIKTGHFNLLTTGKAVGTCHRFRVLTAFDFGFCRLLAVTLRISLTSSLASFQWSYDLGRGNILHLQLRLFL